MVETQVGESAIPPTKETTGKQMRFVCFGICFLKRTFVQSLLEIFFVIIQQSFLFKRKTFGVKIIKENHKSDDNFSENIIIMEKISI